jgi:hypothetical protein
LEIYGLSEGARPCCIHGMLAEAQSIMRFVWNGDPAKKSGVIVALTEWEVCLPFAGAMCIFWRRRALSGFSG